MQLYFVQMKMSKSLLRTCTTTWSQTKLIPGTPTKAYTVRTAMINDAPALLALYQRHFGNYLGSLAPTPTLSRQDHLHNWFQENIPLQELDADNEPQGYLLLTRLRNRL